MIQTVGDDGYLEERERAGEYLPRTASMGPRSDERGNPKNVNHCQEGTHTSFKWGRAPMSAEMVLGNRPEGHDVHQLQWGRAPMSAEMR